MDNEITYIKDMTVRVMTENDVKAVLPLYVSYYNKHEDGCWTDVTAYKRIHQVLTIDGAYALILEKDGSPIGFAMGYFKQYDDIIGYTLEEIVIAYEWQNRGIGSLFLQELERRVAEKGASCVELQAVNDEMHERYYDKSGYKNAKNFVLKVKWF